MKNNYGYNFYKNRHQKTVYSAKRVSSIIFEALPDVHSAIDFGCGVGTWLFLMASTQCGRPSLTLLIGIA